MTCPFSDSPGKNVRFSLKHTRDGSEARKHGRGGVRRDDRHDQPGSGERASAGPEDEKIPDLVRYGYVGGIVEQVAQRRADQENEQASRHTGTPLARGVKLTDVVLAGGLLLSCSTPCWTPC